MARITPEPRVASKNLLRALPQLKQLARQGLVLLFKHRNQTTQLVNLRLLLSDRVKVIMTQCSRANKAESGMQNLPHATTGFETERSGRLERFNAEYRRGGINAVLTMRIKHDLKGNPGQNANRYIDLARNYALLGDRDKALHNLEMALTARAYLLPWAKADPLFDTFHSEPRFNAILAKMNLR